MTPRSSNYRNYCGGYHLPQRCHGGCTSISDSACCRSLRTAIDQETRILRGGECCQNKYWRDEAVRSTKLQNMHIYQVTNHPLTSTLSTMCLACLGQHMIHLPCYQHQQHYGHHCHHCQYYRSQHIVIIIISGNNISSSSRRRRSRRSRSRRRRSSSRRSSSRGVGE